MKQYIKNIIILISLLGFTLSNCIDEPIIRTTTRIRHLL